MNQNQNSAPNSCYRCTIKRIFDFSAALFGLLFLWPLFLILSLGIYLRMGRPLLYRSIRIGEHGKPFTMIKFRTMRQDADCDPAGSITVAGDTRVTTLGAFLRRTKLDELPEIWNVLKGDMSLVGPRPDVPGYADKLVGEDREVLQLKPGITGPATLKYANEEELLASVENPIQYNNEVIFPDKVHINREYLHNMSFTTDLRIIWQTLFRKNY